MHTYDFNLHQSQHSFQVHQSQSLTWRPIIGHELNQSHSAMLPGRVPHSDLLEKWVGSCRIFKACLSLSGLPKLMQFVWNDCEWGKSGVGAVALLRWNALCSWSTVSLKQLRSVQTVVHMMFSGQRGPPYTRQAVSPTSSQLKGERPSECSQQRHTIHIGILLFSVVSFEPAKEMLYHWAVSQPVRTFCFIYLIFNFWNKVFLSFPDWPWIYSVVYTCCEHTVQSFFFSLLSSWDYRPVPLGLGINHDFLDV